MASRKAWWRGRHLHEVAHAARAAGVSHRGYTALTALWMFADSDGNCYPSQGTASEVSDVSVKTLRRGIDELETAGVIVRTNGHPRADDGRRQGYRILAPPYGSQRQLGDTGAEIGDTQSPTRGHTVPYIGDTGAEIGDTGTPERVPGTCTNQREEVNSRATRAREAPPTNGTPPDPLIGGPLRDQIECPRCGSTWPAKSRQAMFCYRCKRDVNDPLPKIVGTDEWGQPITDEQLAWDREAEERRNKETF